AVSEHADLPQKSDLIVEEPLLDDLSVLPAGNRAELNLEGFVRRRMHLAIKPLHGSDHPPSPSSHGAGPLTGSDHHLVRIIVEVILDGLEEGLRLGLMRLESTRRFRLARPEYHGVL